MSTPVSKYRMFVEARTDLTPEEIAKYQASATNSHGPKSWPYRDTGEVIQARRGTVACAFYRALRQIAPIIKIRAVVIRDTRPPRRSDDVACRAWQGFECLSGCLIHAGAEISDEVKHFEVANGVTACGFTFISHWKTGGKPECDKCLAVAVNCHPEMRQYL